MNLWIILLIIIVALAVIGVLMYLGIIKWTKNDNSVNPFDITNEQSINQQVEQPIEQPIEQSNE